MLWLTSSTSSQYFKCSVTPELNPSLLFYFCFDRSLSVIVWQNSNQLQHYHRYMTLVKSCNFRPLVLFFAKVYTQKMLWWLISGFRSIILTLYLLYVSFNTHCLLMPCLSYYLLSFFVWKKFTAY